MLKNTTAAVADAGVAVRSSPGGSEVSWTTRLAALAGRLGMRVDREPGEGTDHEERGGEAGEDRNRAMGVPPA